MVILAEQVHKNVPNRCKTRRIKIWIPVLPRSTFNEQYRNSIFGNEKDVFEWLQKISNDRISNQETIRLNRHEVQTELK
jgi:hypothetical protein